MGYLYIYCTVSVGPLWFSLSLHVKAKKDKTSVIIQISFESAIFILNSNVFSHVHSDATAYRLGTGKLVNATDNICSANKKPSSTLVYIVNQAR